MNGLHKQTKVSRQSNFHCVPAATCVCYFKGQKRALITNFEHVTCACVPVQDENLKNHSVLPIKCSVLVCRMCDSETKRNEGQVPPDLDQISNPPPLQLFSTD